MADLMMPRYRVLRPLGAGGMGEVLLAHDTELDRQVAIKVMSAEQAADPVKRKRFRHEARTASMLVHPNICVPVEVGETPGKLPYFVMEYVEGETLAAVLQERRLRMQEIIHVGIQVAHALEAARRRRIVHRDIKPSNIMIGRDGLVKVLDFGLAKRFGNEALAMKAGDTSTLRTREETLIGTPHYMSPEHALGLEVCHRSDLFSLGTVLYELVAGQRPFLGRTIGEIINNIINQKPESLGVESPMNSPSLEGIIFKCLEKDPDKRYQTARELVEALDQLRMEVKKQVPPPPLEAIPETRCADAPSRSALWGKRGAILKATLAAVAILLLAGLADALLNRGDIPTSPAPRAIPLQSVAVLPFDNLSPDAGSDYLSAGLTEELTALLSRIPGLKVSARNSAFTFSGRTNDLRAVGAALGVATVLQGSLRVEGTRMRVAGRLVNAGDGRPLWSETFDGTLDDFIAVQKEIARKIAGQLRVEAAGAVDAPSVVPSRDALQAYLQARQFWNLRGLANLERARSLFQRAIDLQPDYAPAYAGLAGCLLLLPEYSPKPSDESLPLPREAADKARALDPKSAEALAVLARASQGERDFAAADRLFREALEYNPNFATARLWRGILLREQGWLAEAGAELSHAADLDPKSPDVAVNLVILRVYRRDLQGALEECREALREFPEAKFLHYRLASTLLLQGRAEDAIPAIQRLRELSPNSPDGLDLLARALVEKGDQTGARRIMAELDDWRRRGYPVYPQICMVHIALKEYDQALTAANLALDAGQELVGLLDDPALDPIREKPGFAALLRRAGLDLPPLPAR
jgi:serine/threonine-protein kinase